MKSHKYIYCFFATVLTYILIYDFFYLVLELILNLKVAKRANLMYLVINSKRMKSTKQLPTTPIYLDICVLCEVLN